MPSQTSEQIAEKILNIARELDRRAEKAKIRSRRKLPQPVTEAALKEAEHYTTTFSTFHMAANIVRYCAVTADSEFL